MDSASSHCETLASTHLYAQYLEHAPTLLKIIYRL